MGRTYDEVRRGRFILKARGEIGEVCAGALVVCGMVEVEVQEGLGQTLSAETCVTCALCVRAGIARYLQGLLGAAHSSGQGRVAGLDQPCAISRCREVRMHTGRGSSSSKWPAEHPWKRRGSPQSVFALLRRHAWARTAAARLEEIDGGLEVSAGAAVQRTWPSR